MNERRLIREAAKAVLINQTRAGAKVESNRPNPLSQNPSALPGGAAELPAVLIYTRTTKSEIFDESPRRYRHEAELVVEGALEIQAGQAIDDDLDSFEQEIINAVLRDETLGGLADDVRLTGSANTIDDGGEKMLGAVIITFQAIFFTDAPAEGTQQLDDLATVHTEHSLGGVQADSRDRAKTHIEGLDQ